MKYLQILFFILLSLSLNAQAQWQFSSHLGINAMIPEWDNLADMTQGIIFDVGANKNLSIGLDSIYLNIGTNIGYMSFYDDVTGDIDRTNFIGAKVGLSKAYQNSWLAISGIAKWQHQYGLLAFGPRTDLVLYKSFLKNTDFFIGGELLFTNKNYVSDSPLTNERRLMFITLGLGFKYNFN